MRNFKYVFIAVFFLLVLTPSCFPQNYDSLVVIKSSRSVYLESEPIWTEVEVNIPKEIVLERDLDILPFGSDLRFCLTDESGDTMKYISGFFSSVAIKQYRRHYYSLFHLQYYFGVKEDFPHSLLAFRYKLLPGVYNLRARVGLPIKKKTQYYYSNLISFRVENPVGEELNAQKKLIELEDYVTNTIKSTGKVNGILKKVDEFKNLFPNSRYLPKAEDMLIGFCMSELQDSLDLYLLRKIRENPDNYYNKSHIVYTISHYKGPEETIIGKLNDIADSSKSVLLQKFIDNYIEERAFWKSLEKK